MCTLLVSSAKRVLADVNARREDYALTFVLLTGIPLYVITGGAYVAF